MKPLSVGNVVSAGLRIYRDNFKKYFKLAFIGYLWIFVPIYGWAKYSAMMGTIARLAYGEAAEQPETVRDARRRTNSRKWSFLGAGILVSLVIFGAMIPLAIGVSLLGALAGFAFDLNSAIGGILGALVVLVAILAFVFGLIWLISRLFLVELPLAVEERVTASSTIGRSWNLTKGSVGRIQLVVLLGFLISIPILFVTNVASFILQMIIGTGLEQAPGLAALGSLLYIALALAGGALMIPFWQSIKAMVYYDLRIRREGMGMNLRK